MDILGKFVYREPKILFARAKPPMVTLRGDLALKLLFPYFQEVINKEVELDPKKEHVIDIEMGEGHRFTFKIDGKKIHVTTLPMAG